MPEPNFPQQKRVTGLDLKLRRTAARLDAQDVASAMGVTPARVSQIEALAVVTEKTAHRYLAAVGSLTGAVPA